MRIINNIIFLIIPNDFPGPGQYGIDANSPSTFPF